MAGTRRDPKVDLLAGVDLFRGCTPKELASLAALTTPLHVGEGRVLCREGTVGEEFFVIVAGRAEVAIGGERVADLGPGSFFGEMALLDGGPRVATVTAATEMELLVLNRREFVTVLADLPAVGVRVLTELARRMRANTERAPRADGAPAGA